MEKATLKSFNEKTIRSDDLAMTNGLVYDDKKRPFDGPKKSDGLYMMNDTSWSNSPTLTETSFPPDTSTVTELGPGTAPDEVYMRSLAPWRAAARRMIMSNLRAQSDWIAWMQSHIRTPWWDTYFVYTSSLGTHTFFMTALPAVFFFGFHEVARGLVFELGMGVYVTSFIKDLICAPRPYAPPVTRLTMSYHHLEYGFPSTHSTNSVSIALYIYSLIHSQHFASGSISTFAYILSCIFLFVYTFSIVFGRLYTGMHSPIDCAIGVALGAGIWAIHANWWSPIEAWLISSPGSSWVSSWTGPLVVAALCGVMVHRHPQPTDDCPCFEDAIAFVSVIAGMLVAQWAGVHSGFDDARLASHMAGRALPFSSSVAWSDPTAWRLASIWWGMVLLKLTVGIAIIFVWRLLVKYLLHLVLPPFFRLLSYKVLPRLVSFRILPRGSELPVRRFYIPATEYDGSVPEGVLRPIPSVIDLPTALQEGNELYVLDGEAGGMKRRRGKGTGRYGGISSGDSVGQKDEGCYASKTSQNDSIYGPRELQSSEDGSIDDEEIVKHYDADVLTKVVVYAGIGMLATKLIPVMFEVLGWGVHP